MVPGFSPTVVRLETVLEKVFFVHPARTIRSINIAVKKKCAIVRFQAYFRPRSIVPPPGVAWVPMHRFGQNWEMPVPPEWMGGLPPNFGQ